MRILFAGMKRYEYEPESGLSFEYASFLPALRAFPGAEVSDFAFDRLIEVGRTKGREELIERVKTEKPDLLFAFPYTDELDPKTLKELGKYTKTFAWFADDHWRFYNYSKFLAPHFDAVSTTYSKAVDMYRRAGVKNVVHTQWAANTALFKPADDRLTAERPAVSLVGMKNQARSRAVWTLKKAGLEPLVRGKGWPLGRISEQEMIRLFSISKVNLGLNDSLGYFNANSFGRLFFRRSMNKIVPDFHLWGNFQSYLNRGVKQIKARIFEIPACQGFLLTSKADDLEKYYEPGKEIVLYDNLFDLVEKVRYYLAHDAEREAIAKAGYERTMREHTYECRFREIFKSLGLIK